MEEPLDPSSSSPTSSVTSIPPSTPFVQPPTSSHKTLFIIIGIIILLIIGVISYLLLFKGKDSSSQNSSLSQPSASLSPEQTFIQYRTELAKTKNFDEYAQVSMKWGDKETVDKMQADQEKLDKATPEQKLIGYNLVKALMPGLETINIVDLKKQVDETTATLTTSDLDNKMHVTISLVKEEGAWKIKKESWSSSSSDVSGSKQCYSLYASFSATSCTYVLSNGKYNLDVKAARGNDNVTIKQIDVLREYAENKDIDKVSTLIILNPSQTVSVYSEKELSSKKYSRIALVATITESGKAATCNPTPYVDCISNKLT